MRKLKTACLIAVLPLGLCSPGQAGTCNAGMPKYAIEIRLAQGCGLRLTGVTAVTAVSPSPSEAALADAPSHVRQLSELATTHPGALHAAGYAQDEAKSQHYVTATLTPAEAGYRPLTPVQKLDIFFRSTYSPFTFFSAAFDAGLAHAEGDFRGYGGGIQGYGKRFGAALADTEASVFFSKFLFPWVLKQDPRYFRMQEGPVVKRGAYAVSRVLITRSDSGKNTFNASRVFGRLVVKTLSNSYYPPERRGVWPTLRRTRDGLITDATMSLAREFWPDIRDKILGKHVPKRMKDIGDRVVQGK